MASKIGLALLVGVIFLLFTIVKFNGFIVSLMSLAAAAAVVALLRRPAIARQFAEIEGQSDAEFVVQVLEKIPSASRQEVIAARTLLAERVGVSREKLRYEMTIKDLEDRSRTWPKSWDVADPVGDFLEDWIGAAPELAGLEDVGHLVCAAVSQSATPAPASR